MLRSIVVARVVRRREPYNNVIFVGGLPWDNATVECDCMASNPLNDVGGSTRTFDLCDTQLPSSGNQKRISCIILASGRSIMLSGVISANTSRHVWMTLPLTVTAVIIDRNSFNETTPAQPLDHSPHRHRGVRHRLERTDCRQKCRRPVEQAVVVHQDQVVAVELVPHAGDFDPTPLGSQRPAGLGPLEWLCHGPVEIGNEALDPLLQVLLRREAPSP